MVTSATGAHVRWPHGRTAWDAAAFVLALAGLGAATSWILAHDSDPAAVLWPLVFLPAALTLMPLLLPRTRWFSIALLGIWCVLTGLSIGWLLVPSLFALVIGVGSSRRTDRGDRR